MGRYDIPVVATESSWLPGPYDNRGPSQRMEEDRVNENYTEGISIYMGNETQCLNITYQVWLSIVSATQDYHNKFYMLQASGFKGQEINDTSSINPLFGEMRISNKESDWVRWQQCQSKRP